MTRNSPLLSAYCETAFEIGETHGMTTALRARLNGRQANYIADLSALRRRLIVGAAAPSWLARHNIAPPQRMFEYCELESGAIIVRLHRQQYLLIGGLTGSPHDEVLSLDEGRYDEVLVLAYEGAEIACGGPHAAALVAELCAMDISRMVGNIWIATRFAQCEVGLRWIAASAHYRIVCSPADAQFLFGTLSEMTLERAGSILGINDFIALVAGGD